MYTRELLPAAGAYQRLTGLRVCYHDYANGGISAVLGSQHLNHTSRLCTLVKKRHQAQCTGCDVGLVQGRLCTRRASFVKICHAQIAEIVMPIVQGTLTAGVLFVGQFVVDGTDDASDGVLVQRPSRQALPAAASKEYGALTRLTTGQVRDFACLAEMLAQVLQQALARSIESLPGSRSQRELVLQFVRSRTGEPVRLSDLAAHLSLSESRTSRIVRGNFGKSFPELVTEHRLLRARQLLESSCLTVAAIARHVGIPDPCYFHRLFRQTVGMTPVAYRAQNMVGAHVGDV